MLNENNWWNCLCFCSYSNICDTVGYGKEKRERGRGAAKLRKLSMLTMSVAFHISQKSLTWCWWWWWSTTLKNLYSTISTWHRQATKHTHKYLYFRYYYFILQFLHAYAMSDKINLHMNRILFSNVSFQHDIHGSGCCCCRPLLFNKSKSRLSFSFFRFFSTFSRYIVHFHMAPTITFEHWTNCCR